MLNLKKVWDKKNKTITKYIEWLKKSTKLFTYVINGFHGRFP